MVSEMSNLAMRIVKVRLTRKKSFIMSHLFRKEARAGTRRGRSG